MAKLSKQDREWQADCDCRTLAEAETIKSDPARMKAAAEKSAKVAKESAERTKAFNKIAKKGKK